MELVRIFLYPTQLLYFLWFYNTKVYLFTGEKKRALCGDILLALNACETLSKQSLILYKGGKRKRGERKIYPLVRKNKRVTWLKISRKEGWNLSIFSLLHQHLQVEAWCLLTHMGTLHDTTIAWSGEVSAFMYWSMIWSLSLGVTSHNPLISPSRQWWRFGTW